MECWAVHRQSMAVVGVEVPVVLMILVLGQSMEVEPVEDPELLPLPWMVSQAQAWCDHSGGSPWLWLYQVVVVSLCLVFCVGEKVERGLIIIGGWAVRGLCKRQTDHFAPLVVVKVSPETETETRSFPHFG